MGTLAGLMSSLSSDAATRGRQFERICKWYLENDPHRPREVPRRDHREGLRHMKLSPAQRDRAAGVLVGLAAGDALGAPYEFGPPLTDQPEMKAGLWELGEWTDDTAMALAVADAAANGALDPLVVADHFLRWFASHPKDVGIQTRHVLGAAGDDPRRVAKEAALFFEANPARSAGNGSLMRTAPVALAHLGDDEAIVASATAISDL